MYTSHGHWFSATGQPDPGTPPGPVARCGGWGLCPECKQEALGEQLIVAHNQVTNPAPPWGTAPAPTYETPVATTLVKTPALELDAAPISDWVNRYKQLKDTEDTIKSMLAEAREKLLEYVNAGTAGNADDVKLTLNGVPVVRRQMVSSSRIDGKQLDKDYPELAARYRRTTVSERVTIL